MKKSVRSICFSLVLLLCTQNLKVCAAEPKLPSGIAISDLEEQVDLFVEEHAETTAGMAVAVFDEQEELLKKYYGYVDVENGIKVGADSVFEWGSATKLLVWVSVMQLYEQGKILLEEDIQTYLPNNFLTNLNYNTPITMLHLMNHNAGFQERYADLFVKDPDCFSGLGQALAAHLPEQIYRPGTVTAYSNWGVALAAFIVEQVSGMSFADYVHENILDPLEMQNTAVSVNLADNMSVQEKRKELQCYATTGELLPDCFYFITLYPAGMCTSTLSDFEKFARALLEENSVLFRNPATRQIMFSPTSYFGTSRIPLNCHGFWMVPFGVQTIGHEGNTAGCSSCLLLQPEKGIGVVVMTNQAYETVYNSEMMELFFGQYQRDLYTKETPPPSGIYRTARTVRQGPLKFMSLSYAIDEVQEDELWIADDSMGIRKIVYAYGDYIEVPTHTFILEMGLLLLWIASLAFWVLLAPGSIVCYLIRKRKGQKRKKDGMERWSALACTLQGMALFLLAAIINNVSNYAMGKTYSWMFGALGVLAVGMLAMSVYGILKTGKSSGCKSRKALRYGMAATLLVTVADILYWNLFMFWKL